MNVGKILIFFLVKGCCAQLSSTVLAMISIFGEKKRVKRRKTDGEGD